MPGGLALLQGSKQCLYRMLRRSYWMMCVLRRLTEPDANNNTAELGSTVARNYSKDCSIHHDHTAWLLDFLGTYEMNI